MWKVIAASLQGSSHEQSGAPCQDASATRTFKGALGEHLVVAVADGAGSATRSDEGAQRAVEAAVESCSKTWHLTEWSEVPDLKAAVDRAASDARAEVERLAETSTGTLQDFACTLIVVVAGPAGWAIAHLGDGGVLIEREHGFEVGSWPQQGAYANETDFLTGAAWKEKLRVAGDGSSAKSLAVFSDGLQHLILDYATGTAAARFVQPVARAIRDGMAINELNAQLQEFLRSPRVREQTDDDLTLVVAATVATAAAQ